MLDVSIKELRKVITTDKKARELLSQRVKISEKFDGTKLTLIRNDQPFDPTNHVKNWMVAYKGHLLHFDEFRYVNREQTKKHSLGISQYALVHDHLQKVHPNCSAIPPKTEFLVEFIQNKLTITRDYEKFHRLFLILAAPTDWILSSNRVYTNPGPPLPLETVSKWSEMLSIPFPPVLFEGTLGRDADVSHLGMIERTVKKYEDFRSVLGGKAEGVVIEAQDGSRYKVVSPDQYDKQVRETKKSRFSMGEEKDKVYWESIMMRAQITASSYKNGTTFLLGRLAWASKVVWGSTTSWFKLNPLKHLINELDDMYLSTKLEVEYTQELELSNNKSPTIGMYAIAGKPVHLGHWAMIKQMSQECDVCYLFVSRGGRGSITGDQMFRVWKEVLIQKLPKNVVIRFCSSPVADLKHQLQFVKNSSDKQVWIYVGDEDKETFATESERRVFKRTDTVDISGTQMRQWLVDDKMQLFFSGLPTMSQALKFRVWDILREGVKS